LKTLKKVLNWKDFVWPTRQGIKAANFFGLRLIFFEKKKKTKHARKYIYTPKNNFSGGGYCCLLHSNTRWPQRVRQYSSHPPKIKKMGKMRSPAHTQDATRTRRSSRICRVFHSLSLKNKRGRFVFFFFYFFFLFRWWKPREEFLCQRQMKQNSLGGLKKGAALAFTCCAPLKIQNWWNIRDDELERETTRAWTPPFHSSYLVELRRQDGLENIIPRERNR
jgi:hypothetical protein